MKLPCRHLFAGRLCSVSDSQPNVPLFTAIDAKARWHISYAARKPSLQTSQEDSVFVTEQVAPQRRVAGMSRDDKYRAVVATCKDLAEFCSTLGTVEFKEKADTLRTLLHLWQTGDQAVIVSQDAPVAADVVDDSQAVDDGQAIDDGPGVVDVQAVDVSPTDVDGQAVADSQDVDDGHAVDVGPSNVI